MLNRFAPQWILARDQRTNPHMPHRLAVPLALCAMLLAAVETGQSRQSSPDLVRHARWRVPQQYIVLLAEGADANAVCPRRRNHPRRAAPASLSPRRKRIFCSAERGSGAPLVARPEGVARRRRRLRPVEQTVRHVGSRSDRPAHAANRRRLQPERARHRRDCPRDRHGHPRDAPGVRRARIHRRRLRRRRRQRCARCRQRRLEHVASGRGGLSWAWHTCRGNNRRGDLWRRQERHADVASRSELRRRGHDLERHRGHRCRDATTARPAVANHEPRQRHQ